jgi:hypothetical protein
MVTSWLVLDGRCVEVGQKRPMRLGFGHIASLASDGPDVIGASESKHHPLLHKNSI